MPNVMREAKETFDSCGPTERASQVSLVGIAEGESMHEASFVSVSADSSARNLQRSRSKRFSANGIASSMEVDMAANPEERLRNGQCPSCGQQLYEISTNRFLFVLPPRRKPLNIPGLVNRGQCLSCVSKQKDSDANSLTAATTTSSASHNSHSTTPAIYEGDHNAMGERHGKGTLRWANGDTYHGDFYQGIRQGTGTLNFSDGSEYVGDWWNNFMHGNGTRRFLNGDMYVGEYRYNRREGTGRFYFTNGDLYYGNWKGDKMEGFGRYYYYSGQRFEGLFQDGKRHGKGKLQRTDGSLDLFRYEADSRVGTGVRWSADRTKAWRLDNFRGTFKPRKVTVAEAVALVYRIEGTAAIGGAEDGDDGDFVQMLALEDTLDPDTSTA